MSGLYKPFNFKKDGELKGFDVDIGNELIKRLNKTPKPVTNPWNTIIQGLKSKKYDLIIGSMAITPDRAKQVNFSHPYYRSGAQIFVRAKNMKIKSKADLRGKTIGIIKASTFQKAAEKLTEPDKLRSYDSDIIALQDLAVGRLDSVITDRLTGLDAIHTAKISIKEVGQPLYIDEMGIAIHKDNSKLQAQINHALEEIVKDGTYEKISIKWFGKNILY